MFSKVILVFSASIIVAISIYIIFFISPKNIVESDYASFITGAEMVKNSEGNKLYDLETQKIYQIKILGDYAKNIFLPFRSLPFLAILFIPLSYFDLIAGYKIFALINLSTLLISAFIFSIKLPRISKLNLHFLLPLIFLANLDALFYGQISIILLLIFVSIFIAISNKNDLQTGILAGLLFFKPQFLLALPFIFMVSTSKAELLKGFICSSVLLLGSSLLISGWNFSLSYLNFITMTEKITYGTNLGSMYSLSSLLTFLNQKVVANYVAAYLLSTLMYFISLYFIGIKLKKTDIKFKFSFVIIIMLLLAPHVLTHDLAILTIPLLLMTEEYLKLRKKQILYLIAILTMFLLPLTSLWTRGNTVIFNVSLLMFSLVCIYLLPFKTNDHEII